MLQFRGICGRKKYLNLVKPHNVVLLLSVDTTQAVRFQAEAHLASFFVEALSVLPAVCSPRRSSERLMLDDLSVSLSRNELFSGYRLTYTKS